MSQQSGLQRARYFASRQVALTGARAAAAVTGRGRTAGPVLLTSIPKAGTHLAERALDLVPGLNARYLRTLRTRNGWDELDAGTVRRLRGLRQGHFAVAHLPPLPQVVSALEKREVRVVLVVRDPRDVMVSKATYLGDIDTTHPAHPHFRPLDAVARRRAVLTGVPGLINPLVEGYERFSAWGDQPRTLVVRFEDLVGDRGGGSVDRQREVTAALLRHVGARESDLQDVLPHIFSARSLTFRKGQVGGWADVLDPAEVRDVEQRLGPWLDRYGYRRAGSTHDGSAARPDGRAHTLEGA